MAGTYSFKLNPNRDYNLKKRKVGFLLNIPIKEPRPAFKYQVEKEPEKSNVSFVTIVVPFEKEVPEIQITRSIVEPGKMEIEILENGERRLIGYKLN
jgi:hypothetical protein